MKLLVATGIYPPDIGGPATYTVLLEQELPQRGFLVDHLAFTEFRKKPKIIRHLSYFFACYKKLKNFDLVYAQDPVSVGLPAALAAWILRKPFWMRVAGDYAWEQAAQRFGVKDTIDDFQKKKYGFKTELLRRVQKFVANRADTIITPSKYFQSLVSGWVKKPEKVKVIYNGIKFDAVYAGVRDIKMLMSVGRLVPWKGFDFLIQLMTDPELIDSKLCIVGDGPDKDRLAGIIKKLHLESRVELLGDVERSVMLKNYLPNAGIFILNTSFESFSFSVAESMNAGIPIIATRIGSIPELIEDGKEGILVEPNNKEQILSAIKKIRTSSSFRNDMVMAAHIKAQDFSVGRTVDNLAALLKKLDN